ncbi:hypothetical protein RLEG3_04000 (plasmid) [Rhizobium leguminosarum bv. trifolii WSM1689]|nr:hypothetical protein RLEG3_04000 [Rhizobium leguminosarum bv. trifolii WSM1689]
MPGFRPIFPNDRTANRQIVISLPTVEEQFTTTVASIQKINDRMRPVRAVQVALASITRRIANNFERLDAFFCNTRV